MARKFQRKTFVIDADLFNEAKELCIKDGIFTREELDGMKPPSKASSKILDYIIRNWVILTKDC